MANQNNEATVVFNQIFTDEQLGLKDKPDSNPDPNNKNTKKPKDPEIPDENREDSEPNTENMTRIKKHESKLWYGILLNCGALLFNPIAGFAFLFLPLQTASFALIPFNKRSKSFEYEEYEKELTNEAKNEIDKINEGLGKNEKIQLPEFYEGDLSTFCEKELKLSEDKIKNIEEFINKNKIENKNSSEKDLKESTEISPKSPKDCTGISIKKDSRSR